MNTFPPPPDRFCSFAAVLLFTAVIPLQAASTPPTAPAAATDQTKTHTLFVGTDFSIERDRAFHRVNDVSGGSFVIEMKGRPEFVPANRSALNFKVEQAMKITEKTAVIANLAGERAYSPANSPDRKWTRLQVQTAALAQDRVMENQQAMTKTRIMSDFGASHDSMGTETPKHLANIARTEREYSQSMESQNSAIHNPGYYTRGAQDETAEENFDAVELTFEVSAKSRLLNPYVVVIVRYRGKTAAEGVARNWIYAKSLDPIDTEARKIRIFEVGFPPGFIMEDYEVHIYDQGSEVATNVSPRRVELTEDEAFQYLVMDHIGSNKEATLPPTPIMGRLPEDFLSRLRAGQGQQVYYVIISKAGRVVEAFADDSYSTKINEPYFEAAAKALRFKPALVKGKPAESRAAVNLAKLARGGSKL